MINKTPLCHITIYQQQLRKKNKLLFSAQKYTKTIVNGLTLNIPIIGTSGFDISRV